MSSYQDVDWGYGNDAPTTGDPLPIWALDQHLHRLGYQRVAQDKYAPPSFLLHWVKEGAPPITLAAPQFRAEGYDGLVYDLADIRDMLAHLNMAGLDGHELVARKRAQVRS